jgi:hypothetical protein
MKPPVSIVKGLADRHLDGEGLIGNRGNGADN